MAKYLVKPNFNRLNSQLAFPAKSLNMYLSSEIHDNFGFYQSNFGMYSHMTLNKNQKYVIHTMQGSPLVWQQHKSCAWTPTGSLSVGRREFEPCQGKINEEFCYDELFDSCFEQFLTWRGRGPIELDANGVGMVNDLVRVLGQNATIGARGLLTAGQSFAAPAFGEKTTANLQTLFGKTASTCKGWVELLRELGTDPNYTHLDMSNVLLDDHFDGDKYIGDVITQVYDVLMASAPADLQALINEGGIVGSVQGDFVPLFMVSMSLYNAVAQAYREQCVSVTCLNPRLTRREMTMSTTRGTKPVYVYYVDDVPVIPISDLAMYDRYLTGTMHFAAITASGNIGLGSSFAAIPDIESNDIGILVERETSARDYGKYYFLAHSLFATTIADHDFIVATQDYKVPA